jgi:SAM-dependent methyltransferase
MSRNVGTGPGEITIDGCAVEFYALLPPFGEADIVHAAVPPDASVLELGCGTGRILKPLAELGHRVHGVDDSPGMLAHLGNLPSTRSEIGSLSLNEKFDVVLLASTMLNTDPDQRRRFLDTVRRHLSDDGVAVFQYNPPSWFGTFASLPRERTTGRVTRTLRSFERLPGELRCEIEYRVGEQTWTHTWTSYEISDERLTANLAAAGLKFGDWLTDDQAWFTARPA